MTEAEVNEVNKLAAVIATKTYADRIKFIAVNASRSVFAVSYEPGFSSSGLILTPDGSDAADGMRARRQGYVFDILTRERSVLQKGLYKVGEE